MPQEICAGAIIFKKENEEVHYLLLHYPAHNHRAKKSYWGFAKGHVEAGEKEMATAKREIAEEAGITELRFIEGFREVIGYEFEYEGKTISKAVAFYLAQSANLKVTLSHEHNGYVWLPYREALKILSFDNFKQILEKAVAFLNK